MADLINRISMPEGQSFEWFIARPAAILVLILLGIVARWLAHRLIGRFAKQATRSNTSKKAKTGRLNQAFGDRRPGADARRQLRADTMASLLSSIATTLIIAVVTLMILDQVGLNIAPLLASAGIFGVALGFGAQSLVKDYISGVFMTLEDQYGVGDTVDLGDASGTVEAVGLRITRMRDVNGTVWYVRNGEILRVGNMSQNWARTVLDVLVPYTSDFAAVQEMLHTLIVDMWQEDAYHGLILTEPEVWGIQSFEREGVLIRLALKTAPAEQWAVGRELRERILVRFAAEGIDIPHINYWPAPDSPTLEKS